MPDSRVAVPTNVSLLPSPSPWLLGMTLHLRHLSYELASAQTPKPLLLCKHPHSRAQLHGRSMGTCASETSAISTTRAPMSQT